MKKIIRVIFLLLLLGSFFTLFGMSKSVWVTSWDLTSRERIDQLIQDCKKHDIDEILAEIRYRGDALYFPNRKDITFDNPEPRCYLLEKDPEFDPLAYLIKKAKKARIKVHAWVTTFVVTTRKLDLIDNDNVYKKHPEWITKKFDRMRMDPDSYEGAYLDPGIPAVHLYLMNVFLDIVRNYDLDGIHFDYIRYPDIVFGYNEIAMTYYRYDNKYRDSETWQLWRQNQVSDFLKKISVSLRNIEPKLKISAAVFPHLETAVRKYGQNWYEWLKKGYLDKVYLMAYTTSDEKMENLLSRISNWEMNQQIVVGLRAWDSTKKYRAEEINSKIKMVRKFKYSGISFFSYSGLLDNNYFKKLRY